MMMFGPVGTGDCAGARAARPAATSATKTSSAPRRRPNTPGSPLGDFAELLSLGEALQLLQALVLDLADALAGDVERPPDLVQSPRVLAAKSVAELEHATLAIGEV